MPARTFAMPSSRRVSIPSSLGDGGDLGLGRAADRQFLDPSRSSSSPSRRRPGRGSRSGRSAGSRPARRPRRRPPTCDPRLGERLRRRSTVRRLQFGQSLRARRWATTQSTAEAVRKVSIPISLRRGDRARGVVGVQRGEHHVAGQRRLDRDPRRLRVADLADHHDVGVGAQDRAQPGGEVEPGLAVDVDLVDRRRSGTRPGPRS